MSGVLKVKCGTCQSGRSLNQPPYPAKILHTCDPIEPGRAYWALVPEDYEPPTGTAR